MTGAGERSIDRKTLPHDKTKEERMERHLVMALFPFHDMMVVHRGQRLLQTGQINLLLLAVGLHVIHPLLQCRVLHMQLVQLLLVACMRLLCLVSSFRCPLCILFVAIFPFHGMAVVKPGHRLPCTDQVILLLPAVGLHSVHRLLPCPVLPLQVLKLLLVCDNFLLAGCQGTLKPDKDRKRCLLFLLSLGLSRNVKAFPILSK